MNSDPSTQDSAPHLGQNSPSEAQTQEDSPMKQMGPYLNLGMELFASVAGFGLIGWFIDSKAGTTPLWMAVLLMLGAIGGMYNFIKTALKRNEQAQSIKKQPQSKA